MDRKQILAELTAERIELCDFLELLDPTDWSAASLCTGWTVQDVVAHVTLNAEETTFKFISGLIRARGNFDRMSLDQARTESAKSSPAALVGRLRQNAGSPQRAPGSAPIDPLLDVIIHGQDIARALNQPRAIPNHRALPALQHAVTSRFYGARKRFEGMRLIASDTEWAHGTGSLEVCGTVADLLLVATGRSAGLATLSGDGATIVTERLVATTTAKRPGHHG